jgi:hypothetical protein
VAPHRVLAIRVNSNTLAVDYRAELEEDRYADYELEEMLDELTSFEDINKSVLVLLGGNHYVNAIHWCRGVTTWCRELIHADGQTHSRWGELKRQADAVWSRRRGRRSGRVMNRTSLHAPLPLCQDAIDTASPVTCASGTTSTAIGTVSRPPHVTAQTTYA